MECFPKKTFGSLGCTRHHTSPCPGAHLRVRRTLLLLHRLLCSHTYTRRRQGLGSFKGLIYWLQARSALVPVCVGRARIALLCSLLHIPFVPTGVGEQAGAFQGTSLVITSFGKDPARKKKMETTERQASINGFLASLPILDGQGSSLGAPSRPDPSALLVDNELEMFSDMGGAFWTSGETHGPFLHAQGPSSNLPAASMTGQTPLVAPNGDAPRQNNLMNTDNTFREPETVPSRRASSAADSISTGDPHDKRHDRSLQKKKRNTEAARRSRMRRVAHTASLERQLERLREENHTLISRVAALEQARLRAEQACATAEEARSKAEQARAHDQWTIRRMFNSVQEAKRYLDGSRRMAWTSGEAVPDLFETRMGGSTGLNAVDMSVLDSLAASTSSNSAPPQATNLYISDSQPPITSLDSGINSATVSSQPSCTAPAGQVMQPGGMSSFHPMSFASGIPSGQGGPTGGNYASADTPFVSPPSQAWPGYPSTSVHDTFTATPNPAGSNLPPPTPPYDPLSNLAVSSLTASWLSPSLRIPATATETNYTANNVYPDFTSSMIGLGNDYGMGFG